MRSILKTGGASFPSLVGVRPCLMFTGFLGAGKTTLLRSVLHGLSNRGHLADVILNDCENALLDRETLRDHAASVAALTGSCVCCEGLDELCELVIEAGKSTQSVLLIELNGTADPLPLQECFTLMESRFRLHPRWQVCVIDARYFGKRKHYNGLENLQLETASHYYISHQTDLNEQALAELMQAVEVVNPLATHVTSSALADALSETIHQKRSHVLMGNQKKESKGSAPELFYSSPSKPHLHDRHQLAHEFTGCNIIFPNAVDQSRVATWLEKLPSSVIRAKALLTLTDKPGRRFLYERVGQEVSPNVIPVREVDSVPCSGIFIGPDLQPEEILMLTRELLCADCHFPKL